METNWDGTHIAKLSFCATFPIFKLEYFPEKLLVGFDILYFIFPNSISFRSDNHPINLENMHFEVVLIRNNWRMEQMVKWRNCTEQLSQVERNPLNIFIQKT